MRNLRHRFALETTLLYASAGLIWIAFSDWALGVLVPDPVLAGRIATFKGAGFVIVTSLMLYGLMRLGLRRLEREHRSRTAAEEARRQWVDAFVHCAHGICISSPETNRIHACNPAFARLQGCAIADVQGRQVADGFGEADQARIAEAIKVADRDGEASLEARLRRPDGGWRDVQLDLVAVRDERGRLRYRVGTMQDVTARNRVQAALRESEASMAAAQQVGGFGSWVLDLTSLDGGWQSRPMRWSEPCAAILGVTTELLPRTAAAFFEQVHPDDRAGLSSQFEATLRRDEPCECQHRLVRPDGEVRHVRQAGRVFRDAGGTTTFIGTIHDITQQVRAEAALRESEERFRAVVENIHEVFWMADVTGPRRMLYVSPNYDQMWGRPAAELFTEPARWLATIHPEDRERVHDAVLTKQAAGTYDEQFRIVRPDGTTRWIRDQAFPVKNAAGVVERIVGVAEDVTERKLLEARFLRAQRMEAIGTLAGGIAHDLNNILAPMLMAAGLLKENVTNPHDREMLSMVERSARRGAEIIKQLLTFSRGVTGERVPVELRHLLKEVGAIVRETFPREIRLLEKVPRELWPVVADATQVHQVIVNLCVNARDAMPDGGTLTLGADNVVVTAEDLRTNPDAKPGAHVMFSVADTGMGMRPDVVERIFDPFFTTKDLGKGTGLGLSTVLGIVRSHGGFLKVETALDEGSTFRVYLPAAPSAAITPASAAVEDHSVGNGEMILVVDDEESIRDATRHVLEKHNYRVCTAANGKEAVQRFLEERQNVRLVLTDVMMPEMGGTALIRALRLINSQVRIVATSGLDPEGKRGELAVLGVTEVLLKPCGPQALLDAVRRELSAV